jgi:NodT family efflux transporter outer membrane factor (OMF) lipoprotein
MYKVFLLAVLLAACVRAPAYQAPSVSVAPAYGAVASVSAKPTVETPLSQPSRPYGPRTSPSARFSTEVSPAPFWRELGDTTLTQLIEESLRANTDVRVAEARLGGARASRRLAALDLMPTVTAAGSAMRQRPSIAQAPGLSGRLPQQDVWDVGFDASWEIDLYGRLGRTVGAQRALVASAEHALEDVQVSLAAEVGRTYFELRGAQQQLEVAQRNAENQRRTVALAEDRLAAGRGTAFDTERAKAVLYLTLAATPAIESRIAAGRERLGVLLGRGSETLPPALAAAAEPPRLPDTVRVGSPEQLVRRRPDVLSAERQLAAQTLLVGTSRAEYLPRLTIAAHVGYAATTFDSLTRNGTSRVLVGPVLSWPLLDLGRVEERVDLAEARREEARAQYTATVLRAVGEAESALVAYDRAHARLAILNDAVRASSTASALAQQRFEAGLTDFLQVLDAQRTLLDAENQLADGHTAAATALIALYKAAGGMGPIR